MAQWRKWRKWRKLEKTKIPEKNVSNRYKSTHVCPATIDGERW